MVAVVLVAGTQEVHNRQVLVVARTEQEPAAEVDHRLDIAVLVVVLVVPKTDCYD